MRVTNTPAPEAPTGVTATAGNAQATVSFTPPTLNNGASAITGYTVTSSPGGITATGTASPMTVTALTNGTAYTFTVTATNAQGTSAASAPSNSVTPSASPPGPDPDPLSDATTPTEISGTVSGMKYKAEKQTDGTWLIILPAGSNADLSKLSVDFTLPAGASISPASGTTQDFSKGPVTYTVTAASGKTEKIIVVVRLASPAPTERQYFSMLSGLCEIGYVTNADGTISVFLRIPLASGADPALIGKIDAIRTTLTGVTPLGALSYAYVNTDGSLIPITAKNLTSASVTTPYLQIMFKAQSLNDLKTGRLEKIEYWLKDNVTEYVQTYSTPLAFSEIPLTDETPKTDLDEADKTSGGGCDAGVLGGFGLGAVVLASGLTALKQRRKRGKRNS
jgi:hypothetical protein